MSDDDDLIDFIEFSNIKYKTNELINYFQEAYEKQLNRIKENLLLLNINNINVYTTCINLDRLKNLQRKQIKNLFIHVNIYKRLTNANIINWNTQLASLYPIKTLGDGNCLCHAVLIYLIGAHDSAQILRSLLYDYVNGVNTKDLRERFIVNRKASDAVNSIQSDDGLIEKEWNEIKCMGRSVNANSSTLTIAEHDNESLRKSQTLPRKPDQLVYLEDIHIFTLANLLKRTIIVTALDKIKDLQPINMRGIYLPILNPASECVKEPILIAFHNFHFCPLLYTRDVNDDDTNTNVNDFLLFDDELDDSQTTTTSQKPQRLDSKTYTYFPLVYQNFESMKIHFLKESEEKNAFNYLQDYLTIVEIPVRVDQMDVDMDTNVIPVLGCKIGTNRQIKYNGLATYLDYVNTKLNYDCDETTTVTAVPVTPQAIQQQHIQLSTVSSSSSSSSQPSPIASFQPTTPTVTPISVTTKAIFSPQAAHKSTHTNRSQATVRKKCSYDRCSLSINDLNDDFCDLHKNLIETKRCSSICKAPSCMRLSFRAYDDYCPECYASRTASDILCKAPNCNYVASKQLNGYCRQCHTQANKYAKCKLTNCCVTCDRFQYGGYCEECHEALNDRQNYCRNVGCHEKAIENCNGLCKVCFSEMYSDKTARVRKLNKSLYNQCRKENCSNEGRNNGYCDGCYQNVLYNCCKSRTCTNDAKIDGYCALCYVSQNTTSSTATAKGTVKCNQQACTNSVEEDEVNCRNCFMNSNRTGKTTTNRSVEIPIKFERSTPRTINDTTIPRSVLGSARTTLSSTSPFTTTYQSDFKIPQVNVLRSSTCKNCSDLVSRIHEDAGLCSRCMQEYYKRNGYHYKSNGLLSSTPSSTSYQTYL